MSKTKKYLTITVILSCLFIVAVLTAIITRPQNIDVDTSRYEMVTAKVVDVLKTSVHTKYQKSTMYTVSIEYLGEEYQMGPISSAAYSVGASYKFCLLDGKFYATQKDAETALKNQAMNPLYKISMPGAFVIFIAWIYFFAAYIQSRKKAAGTNTISSVVNKANAVAKQSKHIMTYKEMKEKVYALNLESLGPGIKVEEFEDPQRFEAAGLGIIDLSEIIYYGSSGLYEIYSGSWGTPSYKSIKRIVPDTDVDVYGEYFDMLKEFISS